MLVWVVCDGVGGVCWCGWRVMVWVVWDDKDIEGQLQEHRGTGNSSKQWLATAASNG